MIQVYGRVCFEAETCKETCFNVLNNDCGKNRALQSKKQARQVSANASGKFKILTTFAVGKNWSKEKSNLLRLLFRLEGRFLINAKLPV